MLFLKTKYKLSIYIVIEFKLNYKNNIQMFETNFRSYKVLLFVIKYFTIFNFKHFI